MWGVTRYDYSGTLMNIWIHSHEANGFNGLWLVNGAPSQVGLEQGIWRLPPNSRVFVPAEHGFGTSDARA